jgi:hypothetical protein
MLFVVQVVALQLTAPQLLILNATLAALGCFDPASNCRF